ncbi:molybdopterin cofactor sulfurase [Fusarium albosuccineum]|uniref:Molybdopterin cofactor sulfurase n=1 Tax=Fusarium albosuccineum TaxID=1237068 RepID=A0A8H4P5R3_9HYPO|nr:molybdopterin cofactor sulfurase [Fusarium albosuccineum]
MLLQLKNCLEDSACASTLGWATIVFTLLLGLPLVLLVAWTANTASTSRKLRNLQRIGVSSSNMTDQTDPKFDMPEGSAGDGPIRIKAIFIHPVKSCAPIELDRARLTKTGFMYDRCFAIATEVTRPDTNEGSIWRFISQRTKPLMSQIKTEIWVPHEQSDRQDPLVQAGGCLVLKFPDPDPPSWLSRLASIFDEPSPSTPREVSAIVPLQPTPDLVDEYKIRMKGFAIHARDAKGLDLSRLPAVAAAVPKLKKFLKISDDQNLTLLRCTPDTLVRTDKNLAPLEHIGTPAVHGYTDQQPININSLSSVHAVSSLLPPENQPLNALRFRANIWITGAPAFEEENWKRCRILPKKEGLVSRANVAPVLSVVCRTSRCTLPNVDPNTGKVDADNPAPDRTRGRAQPSTTLVKYRTVEDGNPRALGYLGMHCVPEDQGLNQAAEQKAELYVQVGDEIDVLERGVHLYGSTGIDY